MTRSTLDSLVDQIRRGEISRRDFMRRAIATGVSAAAAGAIVNGIAAQGATPEASPDAASPSASPVVQAGTLSMSREAYNQALREFYAPEEPQNTSGQVVYVNSSDIATLNPTLNQDVYSGYVIDRVFEGLVQTSPIDGQNVPLLADSWEIADDGVTYTFHLNPNVMWHDGTPFTADDVVFTIDSVIDETTLSVRRSTVLTALKSHRKIDDHTVEMTAVDILAGFISDTIGQFAIVPRHIWEGIPFADWGAAPGNSGQDPATVIGTGPFTFTERRTNESITLTRNDEYWDTQNLPAFEQFFYRVVADENSALQSVRTGESDIAGVPSAQVAALQASNPELLVESFDTFSFTYYEFNLTPERGLAFQDVRVRQALMYALDRQLISDTVFQGLAIPAVGTQPVLSPSFAPDRIRTSYTYQPDKAKALLDEAGLVDTDGDGIREFNGQKVSFELQYAEGTAAYQQLIPYMQQVWREVGIEMVPLSVPFPTLVDNSVAGTFDGAVFGFSWGVDGNQGDMYRCDAWTPTGFNDMHYCNEEYDKLDRQQLRELDPAKRVDLQVELTNIINDDQANTVITFSKSTIASQPTLRNFKASGYGLFASLPFVWIAE